ncbi:MAG: hypothetical protein IKA58_02760, partial [Clostridia bacterium]|nr:hypothetical protein [Clostridia bacterium]
CEKGSAPLQVGKMAYDAIVVPGCETLRSSTLARLEEFRNAGGELIFMGDAPRYADAKESDRPQALYQASRAIAYSRSALLDALQDYRTVEIRQANGSLSNDLLYQYREDGDCHWLFVAQGKHPYNHDLAKTQDIRISVKGAYAAELYNSLDGTVSKLASTQKNGSTILTFSLYCHDSLLIKLTPHVGDCAVDLPSETGTAHPVALPSRVPYTLHEPNALLLDMAEIKLDGEDWRPTEELLRADTAIRKQLGYDVWGASHCQPWCMKGKNDVHEVKVRFTFESRIPVANARLAAELSSDDSILLDGERVCSTPCGYYVDRDIRTYALPAISAGTHILELSMHYDTHSALEWCYLLGDFGVFTAGGYSVITSLPDKLAFGDITRQDLPFYSGRITYHLPVTAREGQLKVRACMYRGATVLAGVDGGTPAQLSLSPFTAQFEVSEGQHTVDMDLYISRTNGFGPLHLADRSMPYVSPAGWRTKGDAWSYEYQLTEEGLLSAPVIENITTKNPIMNKNVIGITDVLISSSFDAVDPIAP